MTLNTGIHKNILLKILKDIYTDTSLGPLLGFKGGTAAHFFYNLTRFSVDLDFDLLDKDREQEIFEKLKNIVKRYGRINPSTSSGRAEDEKNKKHTLFILLSYSEKDYNIKIEINKRNFDSRYELKSYLGISMLVMKKEDMFAHKLVAMTERTGMANRDIFDVWFFLENNWEINKKMIEKRTGIKFKNYIQKCIKLIEKLPKHRILSGMGEVLDKKQKLWAKTNLKNDVLFLLKLMLAS